MFGKKENIYPNIDVNRIPSPEPPSPRSQQWPQPSSKPIMMAKKKPSAISLYEQHFSKPAGPPNKPLEQEEQRVSAREAAREEANRSGHPKGSIKYLRVYKTVHNRISRAQKRQDERSRQFSSTRV